MDSNRNTKKPKKQRITGPGVLSMLKDKQVQVFYLYREQIKLQSAIAQVLLSNGVTAKKKCCGWYNMLYSGKAEQKL